MRELSLHILDVVENAIEANAKHVDLDVVQDLDADLLAITVADDGRGMDDEAVRRARDPFYTTRTTRHVGLGIPLFAAAAERCEGTLSIDSTPGRGTMVRTTFRHSHIDRAPLGDMRGTLMCILVREQDVEVHYTHCLIEHGFERAFELDTVQIRKALGDVPLSLPTIREWLSTFITQGEAQLKEA